MSVYINMEMPDGCVVCPFFIENRHDRGDDSLCRASGKEAKCGCPLVPVPPHGRLIEESKILDIVFEWCPDDDGSVGKVGDLREMLDEIEALPTIIPANEEGE